MGYRSHMLETLAKTNESMLAAEEAGDKASLDKYLADEFTIVRATGKTEDRPAYLRAVPDNKSRGRTASDVEIRLQGDRAVFTCCVTTDHNPDGNPSKGRFWNTRVFQWRDEVWRCTAWQVMKLPGD